MATGKLTARRVETAAPGKYPDGNGLYLDVAKTGARHWTVRYTHGKKSRYMGLGSYPAVTLAMARQATIEAHRLRAQGIDPIEARNAAKAKEAPKTFGEAARAYIKAHGALWCPKHAREWTGSLERYVLPLLGGKNVADVDADDILHVLSPIWATKTQTASRLRGRIECVLDYASARKWRDPLNPARWRGHMDKLLPRPAKVAAVRHHPAMDYRDIPGFLGELPDGVAPLAVRFIVLTGARAGEVLGATWDEIQGDTWVIPANRMKARKEHRVPLSQPALAVLEALPRFGGTPYLFAGRGYTKAISHRSVLSELQRLRPGAHLHGLRSTFRDWCAERTSFPREVAEAALAHTNPDKVEAAYQRSDLFEKRRKMMQAWADWCTPQRGKVIRLVG